MFKKFLNKFKKDKGITVRDGKGNIVMKFHANGNMEFNKN